MAIEVVRMPMSIENLGSEYVGFVGINSKTTEVEGIFGQKHEVDMKYPAIMLEREHWENLGKPVEFTFVMEL